MPEMSGLGVIPREAFVAGEQCKVSIAEWEETSED